MSGLYERMIRRVGRPGEEPAPTDRPPAGHDPDAPAAAGSPGFRERGRLRRRARYLRRARNLALRDLGGLVFDMHRFDRRRDDLVAAKVDALRDVDRELRALERALGEPGALDELREAGLGTCPGCGALFGSDARYCSQCGRHVRGPRAAEPADDAQTTEIRAAEGGSAEGATAERGTGGGATAEGVTAEVGAVEPETAEVRAVEPGPERRDEPEPERDGEASKR